MCESIWDVVAVAIVVLSGGHSRLFKDDSYTVVPVNVPAFGVKFCHAAMLEVVQTAWLCIHARRYGLKSGLFAR